MCSIETKLIVSKLWGGQNSFVFNITTCYICFCNAQDKTPVAETQKKSVGREIYTGHVLHGEPCLNFIYNQGQKVTQPFKRTGLHELFY